VNVPPRSIQKSHFAVMSVFSPAGGYDLLECKWLTGNAQRWRGWCYKPTRNVTKQNWRAMHFPFDRSPERERFLKERCYEKAYSCFHFRPGSVWRRGMQ
jgi:hypothetical protein